MEPTKKMNALTEPLLENNLNVPPAIVKIAVTINIPR